MKSIEWLMNCKHKTYSGTKYLRQSNYHAIQPRYVHLTVKFAGVTYYSQYKNKTNRIVKFTKFHCVWLQLTLQTQFFSPLVSCTLVFAVFSSFSANHTPTSCIIKIKNAIPYIIIYKNNQSIKSAVTV